MAKKGSHGGVVKVITYITLVCLVALFVGFIAYFTNGFTSRFASFYVKQGDRIITDVAKVDVMKDEDYTFDTFYLFHNQDDTNKHKGFNYKVVPHSDNKTNFTFYVDGKKHTFNNEKDFTSCFDISVTDSSLTLSHDGVTMEDILRKAYPGNEIELPQTIDMLDKVFFDLVISSYNDKIEISINLIFWNSIGVFIDKEEIVF